MPVTGDGPHIAYYSHTTTNEWYFDRVKNLLDPGYPVTYTNKTNLYPPFSNRQPCDTEWVAQRLAELREECADFAANLLK